MKYKIIYADPPWTYADKTCQGSAAEQYITMDIDALRALPISNIAADDAMLFMWATFPLLPEALSLIEAWGFSYITTAFVWIKTDIKNPNTTFYGLGRWCRGNAEIVLLGKRGKPKRVSAAVEQLVFSPLSGHSKKPDEVRKRIVKLLGDMPRIELFARERVDGWDATGLDLDGRDIREFLESAL